MLKLLGVIMTFNDDDCLHGAIESLLESNHSVYVMDHGSIDSTKKVVENYPEVNYQFVNREQYPNFMVPGINNIHYYITKFILSQKQVFNWVTWIDSDETISTLEGSPKTFYELVKDAYDNNFDGIPGYLREYWVTEADDSSIPDFRNRMLRYENKGVGYCGGVNRSWRLSITPSMTEGTLRHTFFNGKKLYPDPCLLKHYPIRTVDQGYQKINKDRQIYQGAGNHYKSIGLGDTKNLVKPKDWGQTTE